MLNNSNRNEIEKWLKSEMDFDHGFLLLSKYTKNRILLKKRNIPLAKIEFELRKMIRTNQSEVIKLQSKVTPFNRVEQKPLSNPLISTVPKNTTKKKDPKNFDAVIVSAKFQVQELIKRIDVIHKDLYDLGTSNDIETVRKRKEILEKRIPLIEKYNKLYELKEEYFKTGVLDPELKKLVKSKIEDEITITQTKVIVPVSELSKQTDVELLKRKQQLSSSITKTKNLLKYSSIKKLEFENPLIGDDKKNADKKLKDLKNEQNMIINEISRRNG